MGYFCEYKKKRGASPLPVPRVKAFALPCKSKRATLIQRQYNVKYHATFEKIRKGA